MKLFGQTRTTVANRHALIAPDGHVPSTFPGWKNATAFVADNVIIDVNGYYVPNRFAVVDATSIQFPAEPAAPGRLAAPVVFLQGRTDAYALSDLGTTTAIREKVNVVRGQGVANWFARRLAAGDARALALDRKSVV